MRFRRAAAVCCNPLPVPAAIGAVAVGAVGGAVGCGGPGALPPRAAAAAGHGQPPGVGLRVCVEHLQQATHAAARRGGAFGGRLGSQRRFAHLLARHGRLCVGRGAVAAPGRVGPARLVSLWRGLSGRGVRTGGAGCPCGVAAAAVCRRGRVGRGQRAGLRAASRHAAQVVSRAQGLCRRRGAGGVWRRRAGGSAAILRAAGALPARARLSGATRLRRPQQPSGAHVCGGRRSSGGDGGGPEQLARPTRGLVRRRLWQHRRRGHARDAGRRLCAGHGRRLAGLSPAARPCRPCRRRSAAVRGGCSRDGLCRGSGGGGAHATVLFAVGRLWHVHHGLVRHPRRGTDNAARDLWRSPAARCDGGLCRLLCGRNELGQSAGAAGLEQRLGRLGLAPP